MKDLYDRAQSIKNMLLEMAAGNFSYRISRSGEKSELETIIALLNMLAQELGASYNPFVFNVPSNTLIIVDQFLFLLDEEFSILATNYNECPIKDLINLKFQKLLTQKSKPVFKKSIKKLTQKNHGKIHCKVELNNEKDLVVPVTCNIFKIQYCKSEGKYLIVASQIKSMNALARETTNRRIKNNNPNRKLEVLRSTADIKIIQDVREYIMQNLNRPLEPLPDIAHKFGTNEYKLKKGFKELYQTTLFRFHLRERLHLAELLITTTKDPLSNIAEKTGFLSYVHFSLAFKKEYGIPPSALRKQ
ncbi:MAG: hypothetical protein CL868_06325 [Cytophagaceae bacterium]|nr:hypothetical protein [Cytophagaceae bacterium]